MPKVLCLLLSFHILLRVKLPNINRPSKTGIPQVFVIILFNKSITRGEKTYEKPNHAG